MLRTFQMIFLGFLLSSALCGGQEKASVLAFDHKEWDFGGQKEDGGALIHEFPFVNTGKDTVRITEVSVFCRCTKAEYPRGGVAPGGKGIIKVIFDPYGYTGQVRKSVAVRTDLGSKDNLAFMTNLTPRVKPVEEEYPVLIPPGLRVEKTDLGFGLLRGGDSKTVALRVVNVSDQELSLSLEPRAGRGKGHKDMDIVCPKTIAPGEKARIEVTYGPSSRVGIISDTLCLSVESASFLRSLFSSGEEVPVVTSITMTEVFEPLPEGVKGPSCYVSGAYHNFKKLSSSASPVSNSYTLFNQGDSPLVIRDVHCPAGISSTLAVGTQVDPGARVTFSLTLDPSAFPVGSVFETVRILSNDPVNPVRDLMLAARIL